MKTYIESAQDLSLAPGTSSEEQTRAGPHSGTLRLKKLLVPVDFSKTSLKTLQWAVRLAEQSGATISVMHVLEPDTLSNLRDVPLIPSEKECAHIAFNRLSRWCRHTMPAALRGEMLLRTGNPVQEIAHAAQGLSADMIVMGSHHYSWWNHLGQADTVEQVIRTAPCPVLSVPESEPKKTPPTGFKK